MTEAAESKVRLVTRGSDYPSGTPLDALRVVDEFIRGLPGTALRLHDDDVKDALCALYEQDLPTFDLYRKTLSGDRSTLRMVEEIVARARRARVLLPDEIDLRDLSQRAPESPRHVMDGWLPEGEVTLFGGHGGTGKSAIALEIACCIALGVPWCGIECRPYDVTFLSTEDGRNILHWRLDRICRQRGFDMKSLLGALHLIDATKIDPELMVAGGREDEPRMTELYESLAARVAPNSVTVVDGVSDTFGASEITRRHVRRFIRGLRRLAGEHGAVLLLAHVDKAAARDKNSGDRYSGSTAWNNSVRARWELQSDDRGDLTLKLAKANHARVGAEIRLRWDDDAHMHVHSQASANSGALEALRGRQNREGLLATIRACTDYIPAARSGQRTAYHVLVARPELPATYRDPKDGKKRFWAEIEKLRAMGAIRDGCITRPDRHKVMTIELTTEGSGECGQC